MIDQQAYDKLVWFRDNKDTEVGAMAITYPEDPMRIKDFCFLPQECSACYTEFDKEAQSNWCEDQMEAGLNPDNFLRIWAHTHPGQSATPSSTDWETFEEAMSEMPWGLMLILSTDNRFVCVFRMKSQMLNLNVELVPNPVPEAWSEEIKNVNKKTYNQNWVQGKGYTNVSKKNGLQLTFWDLEQEVERSWGGFRKAYTQLTGQDSYPDLDKWSPTFRDTMLKGPCQSMELLWQGYLNHQGNYDSRKLKHMIRAVAGSLVDDKDEILNYDPDIAQYWDPVCLLATLNSENHEITDIKRQISDDVSKYVQYNKKSKKWYLRNKAQLAKDIPELFTSKMKLDPEMALSACMSATMYWPEFAQEIDKACREFIIDLDQQQQEYEQCQKDHEASVS